MNPTPIRPAPSRVITAVPGSGTALAVKSPPLGFVMNRPLAKSAALHVPPVAVSGQKNCWICSGLIPEMGVLNWPDQFESPAPSVTVPNTESDMEEPVAVSVTITGEPAKMEQDSPGVSPAQFVFEDPGPAVVIVYRMVAWSIPLPAN